MNETPVPKAPTAGPTPTWGPRILWVAIAAVAVGAIRLSLETPPAPAPVTSTAIPVATAPGATAAKPEGVLFDWDQEITPGETTYTSGGLAMTMSSRADGELPTPRLTVSRNESLAIAVEGDAGSVVARARVGVGRIDPSSKYPQVIFATYSGGAHCCTDISLIEHLGGAWRETKIGSYDGDGLVEFPKDLDGDGLREFRFVHQPFLYAFASYAQSFAPPSIVSVRNGVVADISAQPRFRKLFEDYLAAPQQACVEEHNNGACAAFVAAAARLGKTDWAWPIMLANYDETSTWRFPSACRVVATDASCPEEQTVIFPNFPEALRWFLGEFGYLPAAYITPNGTTGPSFPCEPVTSQVLRLVCATPELSKADRQLAELYERALAHSNQPGALRESERQFIRTRDAAPSDVFTLLRLYQARLTSLESALPE